MNNNAVFSPFRQVVLAFLIGAVTLPTLAESFRLEDIQIEGLERIEAGTVFTYLPVKVGEQMDESQTADIIRALYKTGLFKDIQLRREENILIVVVQERPAIASIGFDGNKILNDEQLTEVLTSVGIAGGRVFNRPVLQRLENELLQQYFAFGKYSVNINTQVKELPQNRVDIGIHIVEGDVAKIKQVEIVGNNAFEEDELTDEFESGLKPWYQLWGTRNRYAKQKLQGDLETLRSYYLNHGYLKFDIESTQVSISPDREDIFITINIDEGGQYTFTGFELAGKLPFPEEDLMPLIAIISGETFSRARIVQSTEAITRKLNDEGYAFPNINPVPEVDEGNKTVKVTFFIEPGKRVYVRRINFRGHKSSRDEVYRRELRQMEGGLYSQTDIETSRRRIQRLAYVESVDIETQRIKGADDLVDVEVVIKERLAGSFNIGAGYSDSQGGVLSTSVSQENFLGTGKTVSFSINTSKVNTIYAVDYANPYYTIDGVSRGFGFSYISTDAEEANISDFDSDQLGVSVSYGVPLTENDRISATAQFRNTDITESSNSPREIREFIEDSGDEYDSFTLASSFIHDTRDRGLFPNEGNRQRVTLEIAVPGSDLEFYKISYDGKFYFSLSKTFTLLLGSEVGYGSDYGSTADLPFFEKFRAGGFRTVRGYKSGTLGPRDSLGEPFGGDFLTTARTELQFPATFLPFVNENNAKLSLFTDIGNVFEDFDDFETSELRGSFGVSINMITGFGGISAAFSTQFNDKSGDKTESFQFNLGTSF